MDPNPNPVVVVSDAPVKKAAPRTEAESKPRLPTVKNKTQAQRLARYLFGPLTTIRTFGSGVVVKVQIARDRSLGNITLGSGLDFQTAIEAALQFVTETYKDGKTIEGVIPAQAKTNIVYEKRRDLVVKLPDVQDTDIIDALHPNEVLDVTDLVQMRDFEAVGPYIAAATVRNEFRKAEIAKLMKQAEKLKAEIEAMAKKELDKQPSVEEIAAMQGIELSGHTDEPLFAGYNMEDKVVLVEKGGKLTPEMIEDAFKKGA